MHQRKAIYTLFIFIQSLIYGIGNPATKVAYKSITPLWLLAARFTLAFLLFLLLFGRRILPCIKKSAGRPGCLPLSAAPEPIFPATWHLT